MNLMTEAEAKGVITAFARWRKRNKISQATVSRLTGYHTSTISQVLSAKYPGRWMDVAAEFANVLARHRDRANSPQRPGFARTRAARDTIGALNDAHANCWSILIIGERGVGKNWAVTEYARRTKGCLRLRCMPGCTNRSLVNQLAEELGVAHTRSRNIPDIARECARGLANTGQLLVVEEADWLTECCAQTIRSLVDMTDLTGRDVPTIGAVYIGTPAFLRSLERWSSETAEQFHDRIEAVVHLSAPSRGDVKAVLGEQKADDAAVQAAHEGCDGSLRRLASAAMLAQKFAGAGAVKADHFDQAYAQLMQLGKRRAS